MEKKKKLRILFLCTHNSARSQMAEGLIRHLYPDHYEAFSAGVTPTAVNQFAIQVMQEIGVDITGHTAKSINQFKGQRFDYVVTVCDKARETCPFFPRANHVMHKGFEDPSALQSSPTAMRTAFRRLRNEIQDWLEKTFGKEVLGDRRKTE